MAYTISIVLSNSSVVWFSLNVTGKGKRQCCQAALFLPFVGFLIYWGVSLHLITYKQHPGRMDLNTGRIISPDKHCYLVKIISSIMPSETDYYCQRQGAFRC